MQTSKNDDVFASLKNIYILYNVFSQTIVKVLLHVNNDIAFWHLLIVDKVRFPGGGGGGGVLA